MKSPRFRPYIGLITTAAAVTALAVNLPVAGATLAATATYSSTSTADLLSVNGTLASVNLANLELGATTAGASAQPQASTATAANIRAAVLGLAITPQSVTQSAPPDNVTPATQGFTAIDVPLVLSAPLINGSAQARAAASNSTCLPSGSPLSASSTSTTNVTVAPALVPGVGDLADVGAITSTSTTSLVAFGAPTAADTRAVQSQATSQLTSVNLFGTSVKISLAGTSTLTARATGVAATSAVTYTPATVSVTVGGTTQTLNAGAALTIPLDLRVAGTGLLATITLTLGQLTGVANSGTSVSGSATVLSAVVNADLYALGVKTATLANVTLGIGPLNVAATAPADGVQCGTPPAAPVITAPASGSTVTTNTPTISGTGSTGDTVTVTTTVGATPVCGPVTVVAGAWSCVPTVGLPQGANSVTAIETNAAGATPSAPDAFTVTSNPPSPAPTITAPASGAIVTTNTPLITGTGTTGDTVTVTEGTGPTLVTVCGPVTVTAGVWSCTPTVGLPQGTNTITARESNAAGTTPSLPDTFTVTSNPPSPAPTITAPASGSTVTTNTPTISGTGTTGDSVRVVTTVGATPVCGPVTVVAGAWSCVPTVGLPQGANSVTAIETNAAGATPSAPDAFTVTSNPPSPAPTITAPASGAIVTTNTPLITGTGTTGDTVTVTEGTGPTLVTVCGPVTVTAGVWSCTPTVGLPQGTNTITARESNAADTTPSLPDTFTVTSNPPSPAPTITTPASGSTVTTNTPTISGTGTTGDTVTVTTGTAPNLLPVCGPVPVIAGLWSCTPITGLPQGPNTVTANEANAAGTTSSVPDTFIVASFVAAPVITSPINNSTINNGTVAFTGTGTAGDTVTVFEATSALCSAPVSSSGNWNCSPTAGLVVGPHTVFATQTDPSTSVVSGASNTVTFTTAVIGTRFVAKSPYRVLDTRSFSQVGPTTGPLAAGGKVTISAAQLQVPAGSASAIVMNLTTQAPSTGGYFTAYPTDQTQPNVSTLNFAANQTRANLVIVPVAADGSITIYTSTSSQVIADVFGIFATGSTPGGLFHALTPTRLLDTRTNNTALGSGETRTVQVTGQAGVPMAGVSAVIINLTIARPTAGGFLSAFPGGTGFNLTSNVNFAAGDLASTRAIVPVGTDGTVSFYNASGSTPLVLDVTGYFTVSGPADTTGAQFVAVGPTRVIDTRPQGVASDGQPVGPDSVKQVQLAGGTNVPTSGTTAVVANVTAVTPTVSNGWFTQYAAGTTKPLASDVNFIGGDTVANLTISQVNSAGQASLYNSPGGSTHLIEDVSGYFQTLPA